MKAIQGITKFVFDNEDKETLNKAFYLFKDIADTLEEDEFLGDCDYTIFEDTSIFIVNLQKIIEEGKGTVEIKKEY